MTEENKYIGWKYSEFITCPCETYLSTLNRLYGSIIEPKYYMPIVTHIDKGDALPYKNFLDSSIWFYAYDEKEPLDIINQQIEKNRKRYWLNAAKEYRELNNRLLTNAKINGDHGDFVCPFLFHSEQELKKKIVDEESHIKQLLQYKWRILLVDDYSKIPMSPVWYSKDDDEEDTKEAKKKVQELLNPTNDKLPTKLDIVLEELGDLFGKEAITTDCRNENAKIYIDCASTLEEARRKLGCKKYEIVLLDYLLGNKTGGEREYGYELLKGIWYKENKDDIEEERKEELEKLYKEYVFDYKKGPDNRLYFMFISAFTTAVSERLLTEGWLRSEDYWYIGEGACPINTPYLFQYRLLHIMQKRMKDMGLAKWDVKKQDDTSDNAKKKPFACILKTIHETYANKKETEQNEQSIYTELIKEIYSSVGSETIRKKANDKFQDILDLLYHYKSLIKDTHITENIFDSNESVLATYFISKHMDYEGVLEHLTQLVYLTAFGTVRQWPEMWEEYQYIKSVFGTIEEVEKYIVDLKNNSAK